MPAIMSGSFSGSGVLTSEKMGWMLDVVDTSSGCGSSFSFESFFSSLTLILSTGDEYLWYRVAAADIGFHAWVEGARGRWLNVQSFEVRGGLKVAVDVVALSCGAWPDFRVRRMEREAGLRSMLV